MHSSVLRTAVHLIFKNSYLLLSTNGIAGAQLVYVHSDNVLLTLFCLGRCCFRPVNRTRLSSSCHDLLSHGLLSLQAQTEDGRHSLRTTGAPALLASQSKSDAGAAMLRSVAFLQRVVEQCQPGTHVQLRTHGSVSFPQVRTQPGDRLAG